MKRILNYQMNRLLKIELDGLQSSCIWDKICKIPKDELMQTDFNPHDPYTSGYLNRYLESNLVEDVKNESLETAEDENVNVKYLNDDVVDHSDHEESPQPSNDASPVMRRRVTWDQAYLMYFWDEFGFMHMLELNSLINSLSVDKEKTSKLGNFWF